jgi:hypothetical protein
MSDKDDLPVLQVQDMKMALKVIAELKATENELVKKQRCEILNDALRLHRLYHQFSMKEEAEGEFDHVLVSLLANVVKQLSPQVSTSPQQEDGSGI